MASDDEFDVCIIPLRGILIHTDRKIGLPPRYSFELELTEEIMMLHYPLFVSKHITRRDMYHDHLVLLPE